MPIRTKYRDSISLMKELGVEDLKIWEENGALQVRGKTKTPHDRELIKHKVEEENLDKAQDIILQLDIAEPKT
ncbi:MAG: hypothetical protein R6W90_04805 [Ignavibacteriaceae bacterium]